MNLQEDSPPEWSWVTEFIGDIANLVNNKTQTEKKRLFYRAAIGEMIGTFIILFCTMGTTLSISRENSTQQLVDTCVSYTFITTAASFAFQDVSGSHFGPAFTIAMIATRRMPIKTGLAYVLAHLSASILATLCLMLVFPNPGTPNTTFLDIPSHLLSAQQPAVVSLTFDKNWIAVFFIEFFSSFSSVYVSIASAIDIVNTRAAVVESKSGTIKIISSANDPRAAFAPIAVGFANGALTFVASNVSGGIFDPSLSFGPMFLLGFKNWRLHLFLWVADISGGVLAAFVEGNVYLI